MYPANSFDWVSSHLVAILASENEGFSGEQLGHMKKELRPRELALDTSTVQKTAR
jgi:hypothetical protein